MQNDAQVKAERIIMPLVQLYVQQSLPAGLILHGIESQIDLYTRDLVLALRAFALGEEGPRIHEEHEWFEYRFPWYTPQWLRRRRTKRRTITLTFQGKVIYPEQRIVSELGPGQRGVEAYVYGPRP